MLWQLKTVNTYFKLSHLPILLTVLLSTSRSVLVIPSCFKKPYVYKYNIPVNASFLTWPFGILAFWIILYFFGFFSVSEGAGATTTLEPHSHEPQPSGRSAVDGLTQCYSLGSHSWSNVSVLLYCWNNPNLGVLAGTLSLRIWSKWGLA